MKYLQLINDYFSQPVFGRIDDDGLMRVTCSSDDREYLAWVAEGNVAEEWQPEEPVVEDAN